MLLLSKGLADEKGVEKGVKIKLLNGEEREGKIRGQSVEKDGKYGITEKERRSNIEQSW